MMSKAWASSALRFSPEDGELLVLSREIPETSFVRRSLHREKAVSLRYSHPLFCEVGYTYAVFSRVFWSASRLGEESLDPLPEHRLLALFQLVRPEPCATRSLHAAGPLWVAQLAGTQVAGAGGTSHTFVQHLTEARVRVRGGEEIVVVEAGIEGGGQRLTARDESPSPPAAVSVVFLVARLALDDLFDDLFDVANLDEDILGLQVGVNDAAFAVEIVKAQQNLLCDLLDQGHGDAAVVPFLN